MKNDIAIEVSNIHKSFILPQEKTNSIKSLFTSFGFFKKRGYSKQSALEGISFTVKKGEFFGIVGRNGSGKSTLLKMLAGTYQPSKGSIKVSGKIVPFIELGVGFNPELSGRDNVYLNGAMLGFSNKEVNHKYKSIVEFAELEDFMEQKLKNYSSGMQVRLAFSVATILADSDILLLDEVLAVGDAEFQKKCFNYFKTLKKLKKTVVFVSHDMNAIKDYCDRAILIEKGKVHSDGSAYKVANDYTKLFISEEENKFDVAGERWGNRHLEFKKVSIFPEQQSDNKVTKIHTEIKANQPVDEPIIGFSIRNAANHRIMGTNTKLLDMKIQKLNKGETVVIDWIVPNVLNDGTYMLSVAAETADMATCDWWDDAKSFEVYKNSGTGFIVQPEIIGELKITHAKN